VASGRTTFDPELGFLLYEMRWLLAADGLPVVELHMRTGNLPEPTKELDRAMRAGRIHHDGNPVLAWCLVLR
jgi:phage terminase large subunit-like protein